MTKKRILIRGVSLNEVALLLQNGFTFAKEVENNILAYNCNGMACCVPTSYEGMKSQMQDMLVHVLSKLSFIEFGASSLIIRQRQKQSAFGEGTSACRLYDVCGLCAQL